MNLQLINATDRVPTIPNKKKITYPDDSVEYAIIEYADEPVEEGTILNKVLFDKIDNAIKNLENITSYQIPIVNKVESGTSEQIQTIPYSYQSISPQYNYNDAWQEENIVMRDFVVGANTYTPELKINTNNSYGFRFYQSSSQSSTNIFVWTSNGTVSSSTLLTNLNNLTASSSYYIYFYGRNSSDYVYFDYDYKINVRPTKIRYEGNASSLLYYSDDGVSWSGGYSISSSASEQAISTTSCHRYWRLRLPSVRSGSYQFILSFLKFTSYIAEVPGYKNVYIPSYEVTPFANQRILLNIPNDIDMESINSNEIYNKEIETLLQPNKYYELVYNADIDKYIAKEVLL